MQLSDSKSTQSLGKTSANKDIYLALPVIVDSASFISSFLHPPGSMPTALQQKKINKNRMCCVNLPNSPKQACVGNHLSLFSYFGRMSCPRVPGDQFKIELCKNTARGGGDSGAAAEKLSANHTVGVAYLSSA